MGIRSLPDRRGVVGNWRSCWLMRTSSCNCQRISLAGVPTHGELVYCCRRRILAGGSGFRRPDSHNGRLVPCIESLSIQCLYHEPCRLHNHRRAALRLRNPYTSDVYNYLYSILFVYRLVVGPTVVSTSCNRTTLGIPL